MRVDASTTAGTFIGEAGPDGVMRFRAIRYGLASRFALPEPAPVPTHPVDARDRPTICPQGTSRLVSVWGEQRGEPPQSEDCLYLSVTTPSLEGSRPVMVWIHGGGFLTGGGVLDCYDGGRLAVDGDVVVVSINFRLGSFGFLVHDSVADGNLGLWDQLLAIQWVHDNIASFGGNPDNITLFGQSSGGAAILALMSSLQGRGLTTRAIVQSTPVRHLIQTVEQARAVGEHFVALVGSPVTSASIARLLQAQADTVTWWARTRKTTLPPFGPVTAVPPITDGSEEVTPPDLMIGYTRDECLAFAVGSSMTPAVVEAMARESQELIFGPSQSLCAQVVARGGRAYGYEFTWTPDDGGLGAVHCLDLPFVLGTREAWSGAPMLGSADWSQVEAIGQGMRRHWAQFARTGSPTPDGSWAVSSPERPIGHTISGAL